MASANTYSTGNEPRAERHDLALAMPEYTPTNLRPLTKNPLSCRFSQSSLTVNAAEKDACNFIARVPIDTRALRH
jgi:hypothetical protein